MRTLFFSVVSFAEKYHGFPWQIWDQRSIGIFVGDSPLSVSSPKDFLNPVLTAKDVTDVRADFVADPFMTRERDRWYMFFEVSLAESHLGKIGLASSDDGRRWLYQRIVLDEHFHVSYPYVFKWDSEYYMIPECWKGCHAVRLYRAVDFPLRWSFIGDLLKGNYVDPSIFRYQNKWWLFTADAHGCNTLRLFSANDLLGPWTEHPRSPIIRNNAHIARPGGRVLVFDGRIIRYTQDDAPAYGKQLHAFEITELTATTYLERQATSSPILTASGVGWNRDGMHHIDPHKISDHQWIACVDGNRQHVVAKIKC